MSHIKTGHEVLNLVQGVWVFTMFARFYFPWDDPHKFHKVHHINHVFLLRISHDFPSNRLLGAVFVFRCFFFTSYKFGSFLLLLSD